MLAQKTKHPLDLLLCHSNPVILEIALSKKQYCGLYRYHKLIAQDRKWMIPLKIIGHMFSSWSSQKFSYTLLELYKSKINNAICAEIMKYSVSLSVCMCLFLILDLLYKCNFQCFWKYNWKKITVIFLESNLLSCAIYICIVVFVVIVSLKCCLL